MSLKTKVKLNLQPVRRYLERTIALGMPLASAMRLEMTGQKRLKEKGCSTVCLLWDGSLQIEAICNL